MEERDDVVSVAGVGVATATVEETLVVDLGSGDQIEGSVAGDEDGGEIMVEVVGSDVFVDGVRGQGGEEDLNSGLGGNELPKEDLVREIDPVDGEVGEIDDFGKGGDGDLGVRVPQEVADPLELNPLDINATPQEIAEPLEQNPVGINETERGGLEREIDAGNGDVGEIDDSGKGRDGNLGVELLDGRNETDLGGPQDVAEPLGQSPVDRNETGRGGLEREIDAGSGDVGEIDNSGKSEDGNLGGPVLDHRNETERAGSQEIADETQRGGPQEIAEPLEQGPVVDVVNGDVGENDDSRKVEDGDLGSQVLDATNETERGCPQEIAAPLEQSPVVMDQSPVDRNETERGGLEREIDAVSSVAGENDDCRKGKDGDLGSQSLDDRSEIEHGGPEEIAEPLEQSPVVMEDTTMMNNEEGLERGEGSGGSGGGEDCTSLVSSQNTSILDDKAQHSCMEICAGDSIGRAESSCEETLVAAEKDVVMVNDDRSEGPLLEEDVDRSVESVDGMLGVLEANILDDKVSNPGIKSVPECSSRVLESLFVETQVTSEEVVMTVVNEEDLNTKDEILENKVVVTSLPCQKENQSSVVESVCTEKKEDDEVNKKDDCSVQQTDDTVVREAVVEKEKILHSQTEEVVDKENILHSQTEEMECDVLDGKLCLAGKENQSSAVESVCTEKKEDGEVKKNDDCLVQPTEAIVVGKTAVVDKENILHSQTEEMDCDVLDGNLCLVGKENQSAAVESVCTVEKEEDEVKKNDDCLVQPTEDTVVVEAAVVDKENILHSQTEEKECGVFDGKENQSSAVESVCSKKKEDDEVKKNDDCLGQPTEDPVVGEAAVVDKENILHSQTEEMECDVLDAKENQSSAVESVCTEKKEDDEVKKNDESLVQQTEDTVVGVAAVVDKENILHYQTENTVVGEAAVVDKEVILHSQTEEMESDDLDGKLCLVGKENQISAVESVCTEKKEDDEVKKSDDCLVKQTEDTVVGDAAVVDKENILHSQTEDTVVGEAKEAILHSQTEEMESDDLDGKLCLVGKENPSSAVESVCTEKREDDEVEKNDDCLVQQTEDTVVGEVAVVDKENILHSQTEDTVVGEAAVVHDETILNSQTEEMESDDLDGKLCLVGKENQSAAVESVCTEKREDDEVKKNDDCLVQQTEDTGVGEAAVLDKGTILHSQAEEIESDDLDGKLCLVEKDNQSSAVEGVCKEKKEDEEVNKNDDCLVELTEDTVVGEAAVVDKENILHSQTEEMESEVLDGKLCMVGGQEAEIETDVKSVDKKSEAESVLSSKPTEVAGSNNETGVAVGEVGIFCREAGSSTEIPEAAGGSVASDVKISIPDAESEDAGGRKVASPENRLVGDIDCAEAEEMRSEAVGMDYQCDTATSAELESSTVQTEVVNDNEVTGIESKVSNSKLEVPTPVDVDGKLACSEVDQDVVANTIGSVAERTESAVADVHVTFSRKDEVPEKMDLDGSYSGKDQLSTVETPKKVDGSFVNDVAHAAVVESENVLDSKFETMDGDTCSLLEKEIKNTSTVAEKDIGDQANVVSSSEQIESSEVHCLVTAEIPQCNDCDGIISPSGKDEALKVETETFEYTSTVTEKDVVVQEIAVSSVIHSHEIAEECDGEISLSGKDEELKLETDHGSMEESKVVENDSSPQLDSPPVRDHSISTVINNSDSLEESPSLKVEKQETVVQPSETPTHEVDGHSCTPTNLDESVNPGDDAVALSNAVTDKGDPVNSCVTDNTISLPGEIQNLEAHVVSNDITLPDDDQTLCIFVPDVVTSQELVDQGTAVNDIPCNADENNVTDNNISDLKNDQLDDNVLLVGDLVVDLDDCIDTDKLLESEGDSKRDGCTEELQVQEQITDMGEEQEVQVQEQGVQVQEQITDTEQVHLHGGEKMQSEEQAIETENPEALDEKISEDNTQTTERFERAHLASSFLALEDEGEFLVSDLVWGKVRSHPWWPGQIFDSTDASEKAIKHLKKDSFLVAYFGDRTFAWNEAHLLKPFCSHFSQVEKQSNSELFHTAVSCALEELARRIELGMACSCIPKDIYEKIEHQTVENTGIRQESSRRHGVNKSMGISSFEPTKLLDYIRTVAGSPSGGVDRLELVIAEAQLLAISRLKGFRQLPEFHICGGLIENDVDTSPLNERDPLPGKSKSKTESTSRKRKHNLKEKPYPWKKEKSLSELMGGDAASSPEGDIESDDKAMVKSVSSSTGKKRKAVDSASDGSRVNFYAAKVSKTVSPIPKPSFKIGDCIRRVASQLTGSPSILKNCNQKVDGNGSFNIESSSLEEILSQLRLAAWDPLKGYGFVSNIVPFFSAFRNTVVSRRPTGRKKKASNSMVGSPEEFEFDDVSDSYWTDMIVQNNEEDPTSTNQTAEGGVAEGGGGPRYEPVALVPDKSIKPSRRTYSRKRFSHEFAVEEPTGIIEERKRDSSPTELILNFNEGDHIPSEVNLNKIFRRFGPLKEAETEIDRLTSRARVIFKKGSDAEVAYNSAGKFNIFGTMLVSYQISHTPSLGFGSLPLETLLVEDDDAT